MAISLPNGAFVYIASGYAAADTVSAVTSANPAVATTSAAHGISTGDFIEVTSGWSRLDQRIVRAAAASASVITYEGYDASSTATHPTGGGAGSIRAISGWTQITQILGTSSSGGEQQFAEYQLLEADSVVRMPTVQSAYTMTLTLGDDSSLSGYAALKAAGEDRLKRAFKIVLPSGAILLYNGYVGFRETPTMNVNQPMQVEASISLLARPTRYTS
jgi:hypothetical protein